MINEIISLPLAKISKDEIDLLNEFARYPSSSGNLSKSFF